MSVALKICRFKNLNPFVYFNCSHTIIFGVVAQKCAFVYFHIVTLFVFFSMKIVNRFV
uniref:Uncharacterized protein n=1 Tax=Anguilla anguilla TaxID=7936 RepID=A0A0E9QGP7_ANGAN